MTEKHVWEFTNQKKLSKKEFINYFERKVFRTIRKYDMLPKNKIITLKQEGDINTKVLKKIIETKFEVKYSDKPNTSSKNSSDAAEQTFQNILQGKFKGPLPTQKPYQPLYFISDKELELYAKLNHTNGTSPKRNPKIQNLFKKFLEKNQDLELNITKALGQTKEYHIKH
jgi:hypothetical protein